MEGFTDSQLDKLADILILAGQVLFASLVVPFFSGGNVNPNALVSGGILTSTCWLLSLFLIKGVEK